MDNSPDSEIGVFAQLGDFLHWDGLEALTPTSEHIVDADTRYSRLVEISMTLTENVIQMLASKHKKVVVITCEGNHDIRGSLWLRKFIKFRFRGNKNIIVDDTDVPYYAYQHGNIMLAWHHGHKVKNKSLPEFFSSDPRFRPMWGACKYTYISSGHYHRVEQDLAEGGGAIVERHPTLAARDAYAARGGWVSQRAAKAITYHKDKGKIFESVVYPELDDE